MTRVLILFLLLTPTLSSAGWQDRTTPPELPSPPIALIASGADVGITVYALGTGVAAEASPLIALLAGSASDPLTVGLSAAAIKGLGHWYAYSRPTVPECEQVLSGVTWAGFVGALTGLATLAGGGPAVALGIGVVGGSGATWAASEYGLVRAECALWVE